MQSSYNDSLAKFKSSFLNDTECDVWVEGVTAKVSRGAISVLDIGAGDCDSISRRCALLLQNSITVHLTGIDPCLPGPADRVKPPAGSVLINTFFEDYRPSGDFDVVNATHALYYLSDIPSALLRIVSMAKPGGLVVLTVWTQDCILSKLFRDCFSSAPADVLTAETVLRELDTICEIEDAQLLRSFGDIDLGLWASDDKHLDAAVRVISRGHVHSEVTPAQRMRLKSALRRYAPVEKRVNGIVVGRKARVPQEAAGAGA